MSVYPICFSIPESKIVDSVPEKTKLFGHIIPGDLSTYIFTDEESYAKDYQTSVFGKTQKKGGWDCIRHYEILANGCIPWFQNLDDCPEQTLFRFPKTLVKEAMESKTPKEYIPQLLEYTRKMLSCRSVAQYVFDTVGCPQPKRVLFLSGQPNPDYLRCLTLIGMKQILGNQCMESIVIPHIYEDYPNPRQLYGRGFTYSRILPVSSKPPPIHIEDLRSGSFDLVVYGSIHRSMPYWDEVIRAYPPHRIVLLCGEDCDSSSETHTCMGVDYAKQGFQVFIRELSTRKETNG
jgi:hypothetical protein